MYVSCKTSCGKISSLAGFWMTSDESADAWAKLCVKISLASYVLKLVNLVDL